MAFNNFFIVLGRIGNYLEKTTSNKWTLPLAMNKISLDTSSLPKSLSVHCKYINRVANNVNRQSLSSLSYMQISDYKGGSAEMYWVSLDLQKHHCHLD